ncbi:MAG: SDR family oxidoreductase, partial [Candidatus Zixiibacteriota bacterium]
MNPRETNILVVGGAGMLGRPVAERLRLDGFTVTVMSTRPESASKTLGRDFRVVYGDVTLPETLRAPLEGQQCVFINLNSNLDERRYLEVEVAGTANVARLARETGAQRIGMISGASSHGEEIGVIYVDAKVR